MGGNGNKPLRILFSAESPGPTNFFNAKEYKFLNAEIVSDLVNSGVGEIAIEDIPYILLLNESGRFYDTTRSVFISEDEAKRLTDSRNAIIKIVLNDSRFEKIGPFEAEYNKDSSTSSEVGTGKSAKDPEDKIKEKLLIGTTAAAGTTAIAAGAASVPFAMGFTSAGVAAGSAAAAIQSGIGSVAAGSGFAIMQSIAATTVIGTALPMVVAGAAIAGTAASGIALHKHLKKKKQKGVKDNKGKGENEGNTEESTLKRKGQEEDQPPPYDDPPPYSPI